MCRVGIINKNIIVMKKFFLFTVMMLPLFAACNKPDPEPSPEPEPDPIPVEKQELSIGLTRTSGAADSDFLRNDKVGLYVVNYKGSQPGSFLSEGNHVDNMGFTYLSVWSPDQPIYWADNETKADFYCYYPYSADIENVENHLFGTAVDQSTLESYRASDFLLGKVEGATPSADPVTIKLDHKMSRLVVSLVAGNGYSAADMESAEVTICSIKTGAKINLATGQVEASGSVEEVIPYAENGGFCAYLVPQTVTDADFVKIVLGDRTYVLNQSLTLESGKQHKCTITVARTDQGINIGVSDWVVDSVDYGGTVE